MLTRALSAAMLVFATPVVALADPVGTYNITGTNLDEDAGYTGQVTIKRTGGVYAVTWHIGDKELTGIGLGGKLVGSNFTVGPASPEDNVVSLGYTEDGNTGMGIYLNLPDGSWQGVWTSDGSEKSHPEKWVRVE